MVNMIKWVSYDNERSVKLKAELAYDMNLTGLMVWSIETDDFHGTLLRHIFLNQSLHHNSNVSARICIYLSLGNCGAGKYPLLRALNVALSEKSSISGDDDDGGLCDENKKA